jgi:large subunit ribosomal protein L16
MLNSPRKTKYRKVKKGKLQNLEFKANKLTFGKIGLKAAESGIINAKQIEAARQAISRKIKRNGKLWVKIFPNVPITSKSVGTRMGKGKGNVSHWGSRVRGGTVLFEVCGIKQATANAAFRTGGAKLPIKTKIFM